MAELLGVLLFQERAVGVLETVFTLIDEVDDDRLETSVGMFTRSNSCPTWGKRK